MKDKKKVFITGIAGGIGQVLGTAFSTAGFYVYGTDLNESGMDYCDEFFHFDLNSFVKEQAYASKWESKFHATISSLDVLINNAAVQLLGSLAELSRADWAETLNVNLSGPLLLSQLFSERLESCNGSIINIGSIHERLTKKRFISYATSKSALIGLTKALAVDLEGKIRVNAISPAAVKTQMLLDGFNGKDAVVKKLEKMHPVNRIGLPQDVARLALFIASENNGFIHGANFQLDGGMSSVLKDIL